MAVHSKCGKATFKPCKTSNCQDFSDISVADAASHGVRSIAPLAGGIEQPEVWRKHRSAIMGVLSPMGPLEVSIAEDVASLVWRIENYKWFEVASVERGLFELEADAELMVKDPKLALNKVERLIIERIKPAYRSRSSEYTRDDPEQRERDEATIAMGLESLRRLRGVPDASATKEIRYQERFLRKAMRDSLGELRRCKKDRRTQGQDRGEWLETSTLDQDSSPGSRPDNPVPCDLDIADEHDLRRAIEAAAGLTTAGTIDDDPFLTQSDHEGARTVARASQDRVPDTSTQTNPIDPLPLGSPSQRSWPRIGLQALSRRILECQNRVRDRFLNWRSVWDSSLGGVPAMKLAWLGLVFVFALFSVAAAGPPPEAQNARVQNRAFSGFVDIYFGSRFQARPSEGTAAGLHDYDNQLENLSRDTILARITTLKRQLMELKSFDKKTLSFDEAIDAAVIKGQIQGELLDLETLRVWETNPMGYLMIPGSAVDGLIKRNFAAPARRLESVIARIEAIPALHIAARENLKNPPKEFTDLAIRMAKGSVGFFEKSVTAWAKGASGNNLELLKRFEVANAAAIASTKALAGWLETDLKPRSTGSYAIGADHFLAKLEHEELVEISLADLLAKGEANLAKDYRSFVETAKKIDPTKTPAEVMKKLSDDHPSADDLIPSARRSIEQARQFLIDRKIVTVPSEVRPKIEETPPYARSGSFASMDTPGPFETKATEAFYYVTPVEKDWDAKHAEEHLRLYNPPVMAMINIHEAYPGHFLQFLYAPKFPTKTRKLVACGTNVEGWAHYCEQMMVDEGFGGSDPKIRLAQLQEALLRDCRYVVGVKLHTQGMTVEEGAKVFVEKAFQEPANAYEESRRGAYNPTYLYYTFGKLQILELREEFLSKKKGKLEDFHNAFVAQGGIPIALVRKILFK